MGRVLRELNEADDGWWRDAADVRRDRDKGRKGKGKEKRARRGALSARSTSRHLHPATGTWQRP